MNPQPPITRRCPFCGAPPRHLYASTHTTAYRVYHRVECRFCTASGPTSSTQPNCSILDTSRAIAASIFDWNHHTTTTEWGAGGSSEAALKLYDRRAAFINKHCNPAKPTTKGKTKP